MKIKYKDLSEQDRRELRNLLNFKRRYLKYLKEKEKAGEPLKKVDKVG